jgi:hypothetical protein
LDPGATEAAQGICRLTLATALSARVRREDAVASDAGGTTILASIVWRFSTHGDAVAIDAEQRLMASKGHVCRSVSRNGAYWTASVGATDARACE